MAKLYFRYGAMNSGKSTALMQVAHNYEEQGMKVLICLLYTSLAADEHGAGLCALVGADDALLLHFVHDAGGAGVAQLAAALQQAGGGPVSYTHLRSA